jgi:hypothetical protein
MARVRFRAAASRAPAGPSTMNLGVPTMEQLPERMAFNEYEKELNSEELTAKQKARKASAASLVVDTPRMKQVLPESEAFVNQDRIDEISQVSELGSAEPESTKLAHEDLPTSISAAGTSSRSDAIVAAEELGELNLLERASQPPAPAYAHHLANEVNRRNNLPAPSDLAVTAVFDAIAKAKNPTLAAGAAIAAAHNSNAPKGAAGMDWSTKRDAQNKIQQLQLQRQQKLRSIFEAPTDDAETIDAIIREAGEGAPNDFSNDPDRTNMVKGYKMALTDVQHKEQLATEQRIVNEAISQLQKDTMFFVQQLYDSRAKLQQQNSAAAAAEKSKAVDKGKMKKSLEQMIARLRQSAAGDQAVAEMVKLLGSMKSQLGKVQLKNAAKYAAAAGVKKQT